METLINSSKLCVWRYSPSELRLVLKTYQPSTFKQLNRLLKAYPSDTSQGKQDEPQFRLPSTASRSLIDEMVGVFGLLITRTIWPEGVGSPKMKKADPAPRG
jgi:hypothetical protein